MSRDSIDGNIRHLAFVASFHKARLVNIIIYLPWFELPVTHYTIGFKWGKCTKISLKCWDPSGRTQCHPHQPQSDLLESSELGVPASELAMGLILWVPCSICPIWASLLQSAAHPKASIASLFHCKPNMTECTTLKVALLIDHLRINWLVLNFRPQLVSGGCNFSVMYHQLSDKNPGRSQVGNDDKIL